jgi:hypothetical protein
MTQLSHSRCRTCHSCGGLSGGRCRCTYSTSVEKDTPACNLYRNSKAGTRLNAGSVNKSSTCHACMDGVQKAEGGVTLNPPKAIQSTLHTTASGTPQCVVHVLCTTTGAIQPMPPPAIIHKCMQWQEACTGNHSAMIMIMTQDAGASAVGLSSRKLRTNQACLGALSPCTQPPLELGSHVPWDPHVAVGGPDVSGLQPLLHSASHCCPAGTLTQFGHVKRLDVEGTPWQKAVVSTIMMMMVINQWRQQ